MAQNNINPLTYITDFDPIPLAIIDASGWFLTEYLEYQRGGLPLQTGIDLLPVYAAQGWLVYDHEDGSDIVEVTGSKKEYFWTKYFMNRRRLQSERVLQTLITDFTESYNEGRQINDTRYDELVALYDVMLTETESELGALCTTATTYVGLLDTITNYFVPDYDTYAAATAGLFDDWGDAQRLRINNQFDAEVAAQKQGLTDRGMYNSTVWTTVQAGIELRRAEALTDLEDTILARQEKLLDTRQNFLVAMRKNVYDARARLLGIIENNTYEPMKIRNIVLQAMLAFMERRTDEYPSMQGLAELSAKLGYSDTPSQVVP